jgi:hypothetical protein
MSDTPKAAGSMENDLIESMLRRQSEVISSLESLADEVESVILSISQQRQQEAENSAEDIRRAA